MALKLTVNSPDRRLFENRNVLEVTLPGSEGEIQILPEHSHMVGTLETGIFSFKDDTGKEEFAAVSSGFFEVAGDKVTVLAETLELKAEISLERAKKAQTAAEIKLGAADLDPEEFRKFKFKLQRALVRQQVASDAESKTH